MGKSCQIVREYDPWLARNLMQFWSVRQKYALLRAQDIAHALPRQTPKDFAARPTATQGNGLFVAGDYVSEGSIDSAMRSGRLAAELALRFGAQSPSPRSSMDSVVRP